MPITEPLIAEEQLREYEVRDSSETPFLPGVLPEPTLLEHLVRISTLHGKLTGSSDDPV